MKIFLLLAISIVLTPVVSPSQALSEIFQYIDEDGTLNYTNVFSRIAEKYRDKLIITAESVTVDLTRGNPLKGVSRPAVEKKKKDERTGRTIPVDERKIILKKTLETKYGVLLAEKASIDTNKSYQRRKIKRRYKHRPYIVKMRRHEAELDEMIIDIENQLLNCNC